MLRGVITVHIKYHYNLLHITSKDKYKLIKNQKKICEVKTGNGILNVACTYKKDDNKQSKDD